MANEKNSPVNTPIQNKPGNSSRLNFDRLHWFIKLFMAAALAGFILVLGITLVYSDMLHQGKNQYGCGCGLKAGKNMIYFNKAIDGAGAVEMGGCPMAQGEQRGGCGAEAGGCPMAQGFQPGMPATTGTVSNFTAPTTGAFITPGDVVGNPYEIKDLSEVFVVSGTVTAVTTTSITLADANKIEKTVSAGTETKVKNGEAAGQLSDIKVGDNISVVNLPDSDGAMSAQLVRILGK